MRATLFIVGALVWAHARLSIRVNAIRAGRVGSDRVREAFGMPGAAGAQLDLPS